MLEDSGEGQTCNLTTKLSRIASRRFKKRQRGERKEPIEELTWPQHGLGRNGTKHKNPSSWWARGLRVMLFKDGSNRGFHLQEVS